ncbi:MAG: hypothetical protein A2Z99_00710 [Treponema sp. GWB1_62_6]|nr:MAG: hypothetical protein A2Y36_16520 [Treponema sp. GWA1_62_8]OHE64455.1 MAG: hypothetical protein A2001_02215 [Treponema sp. GWC1_61_84]OHE67542.1 MAG: hypothetical protein A2Z99_00710 [Treponema sp. GWB1_62_6]HCM26709.1 hypothetical protein [Treponema sp.]
MRIRTAPLLLLLLALPAAAGAQAAAAGAPPTAAEILARVDANEAFGTVSYTGTMEIDLGKRTLVKEMKSVAEGAGKAFVEFTNPEDRGVRYLKIAKDLWMYFPGEQETVKISGHLLKEGMMGSDVSYEDALESDTLSDKYAIEVIGSEQVDGRACWVLDLRARVRNVPYERQKLWIDAERFIALKGEMYAKSGKLLKESRTLEVRQFGVRWLAVAVRIQDKLRKGNGTVFSMKEIEFDVKLPADQFSLRQLGR